MDRDSNSAKIATAARAHREHELLRRYHEEGDLSARDELADAVDEPCEEVLATVQSAGARRTRSLDEPTGENATLADSLGRADPEIRRAEIRVLLAGALDVLSLRDREVLRLRFAEDLTQ